MSNIIRQRRMQANYLNCTTGDIDLYALLGVGAKTIDENPSAQVKSKKYVCDKCTTKSVSGYDWSSPFDIDQIREQLAINFIVSIGERQLTGEDAESDYCIVDLDQPIEGSENTYHARHFAVAIEVSNFTNDDGDMGCTGNFHAKGDPEEGTFNTTTKVFTPTTAAE